MPVAELNLDFSARAESGLVASAFGMTTRPALSIVVLMVLDLKLKGQAQGQPQGLRIVTPMPSKSFTLRVTKVKPCSKAVAASSESMLGRGRSFPEQ